METETETETDPGVAPNQFREGGDVGSQVAPMKVRLRRASIKIFIGQAGYIFILAGNNVAHH